ncbi:MAG TPA: hypothetical protein VFE47_17815 [Tepidisphaeraceae bacterium]|nr:hypothetical protein [Tepidisphaeraceae bacterium]
MTRLSKLLLAAFVTCSFAASGQSRSAEPAAKAPVDPAPWVNVSDPVVAKLKADGKKLGYPGDTAGVVVDVASGDVYMIVAGLGIWKSTDGGKTFARVDDGKIGGRCESSFALNADPAGKRIACFMLDGPCAWTGDSGATWNPMTGVGRNWDYAAVDWSGDGVKNIFAAHHEDGGQTYHSTDGGKSWTKLFKQAEFDKTGGLGIFDANTLVYTQKGSGIQRSTDGGQTWMKISDTEATGRVVRVLNGTAYWMAKDGILISKDKGATWTKQGTAVDATIGPMLDAKNEKHMAAAGMKGIFETSDGGETWKQVGNLPPGFSMAKAGWFANVAWDPARDIFYASQMGKPTYKLEVGKK